MEFFVCAMAVSLVGGIVSLVLGRRYGVATFAGVAGAVAGAALAMVPAITVLAGGRVDALKFDWSMPLGSLSASFHLAIDPLTAFFLVPIAGLSAVAAVYGSSYLLPYRGEKNVGASWFHYNVLMVSMMLVVAARDGMLFLIAWELMSLASFFLVMFDDRKESVRQAGWTYLVATHIGTAFLLVLFVVLAGQSGSLDFDSFGAARFSPQLASAAFLLAVVGFGTKAGFMPLHVWLPEAHPAAPSHVSAVMSGVMIKTGIYGLLRTLMVIGDWQPWWGWVLVGIGAGGGILGVLYALAQHDLKRLLAYHSVENIGIIALGVGVGVLGRTYGMPLVSVLGFAGAILHVLNHAMFKGLLFLGAGAVIHATHSGEIDRMGGLLKRMPTVAATFLVGSAAICGLPPLNGFVSELLIYLGAFKGCLSASTSVIVAGLSVIAALAMIGGLAAACFTKAFGIIFLGKARTAEEETTAIHRGERQERGEKQESGNDFVSAPSAVKTGGVQVAPPPIAATNSFSASCAVSAVKSSLEPAPAMRWAMIVLAAGCVILGLCGPIAIMLPGSAASLLAAAPGADGAGIQRLFVGAAAPIFWKVTVGSCALLALLGLLAAIRAKLLASREIGSAGTWDCGYIAPTARMQYTASSFAQPITNLFRKFLGLHVQVRGVGGLFPVGGQMSSHAPDVFLNRVFAPIFSAVCWVAMRLRWLQHGRLQLYILYIAATLLILMVWKLS